MGYQLSAYFYSNLSYQKCVWFIFVSDSITKILCLWTCTYERKGYIVAALLIYLTVHNPHHMGMTQGDIFMCLASPCWWCTCSYPKKKTRVMILKMMGLCYHKKPEETIVIGGLFGTLIHDAKTRDLNILKYSRLNFRCIRYSVYSWWIFYQGTTILSIKA